MNTREHHGKNFEVVKVDFVKFLADVAEDLHCAAIVCLKLYAFYP